MSQKPIVLHLGDAIKYNHKFYNQEFLNRLDVVRNNAETREDFIQALQERRLVTISSSDLRGQSLITADLATSLQFFGHISKPVVKWANGTTS